jgi:putative resolvase
MVSATNSKGLVSISQVANRFGVCQETLRRAERAGHIRSYRANARSHRRYDLAEIAEYMGVENTEEDNHGAMPVCYCRTSSLSQKDSLKNQVSRMIKEVSEIEGIEEKDMTVYQECRSAFSRRDSLNSLTEDCISGKVSKVYVLWLDRLGRDGMLELFKSICRNRGIEIIVVDQDECTEKNEMQAGLIECMNYLQVIINRRMGKRGGERTKKEMEKSTLDIVMSMYMDGQSGRAIEQELKRRKIRDNKGRIYGRGVILRRVRENLKAYQEIKGTTPKNSCEQFLNDCVNKSQGKTSISRAKIAKAYSQFCHDNNLVETSSSHLTKCIDKLFNPKREYKNGRSVVYKQLSLNINKGNQG